MQSGGGGLFFLAIIKDRRGKVGAWERLRRVVQLLTGIGRHQQRLHYCIVTFSQKAFIYCLMGKEKKCFDFPCLSQHSRIRSFVHCLIESEFLLCGSLVHLRKAFKFLLHQAAHDMLKEFKAYNYAWWAMGWTQYKSKCMKSTQLIMGITDPLHQRRLGGWLKALQPRYDVSVVSRRADEFVQCVVSFQRQKVTNSWFDAILIVMVSDPMITAFVEVFKYPEYPQDFGLQNPLLPSSDLPRTRTRTCQVLPSSSART